MAKKITITSEDVPEEEEPVKPWFPQGGGSKPIKKLVAPKIREMLLRRAVGTGKMTNLEAIIQRAIDDAIAGDMIARNFLVERIEGRVAMQVDLDHKQQISDPLTDLLVEVARRNQRVIEGVGNGGQIEGEIVDGKRSEED